GALAAGVSPAQRAPTAQRLGAGAWSDCCSLTCCGYHLVNLNAMKISAIGMYQFSQTRRPLGPTVWAISPSAPQTRKTTVQTEVSTRLMRLNAAVCQAPGAASSLA